jgi:hypothetical protein
MDGVRGVMGERRGWFGWLASGFKRTPADKRNPSGSPMSAPVGELGLSFADHIRVLAAPETERAGLAGSVGQIYGFTTPSITGISVVGDLREDFAIAVQFEGRPEAVWLAAQVVELVDHAPGTEIGVGTKRLVRDASGEWTEPPAME